MNSRILISAGDPSGDLLASLMVRALKRLRPDTEIWALGGPELKKCSDVFLEDLTHMGLMGWAEPLRRLPYFWLLRRRIRGIFEKARFDAVIPVDYYGFNIHVARMAKEKKFPVIYYVSPQVWASRAYRARKIRRFTDRVLCLYPFEPSFYANYGVEARFVGHPMAETLSPASRRNSGAPLVGLLPGSRPGEIQRHMPVLLEVWRALLREVPAARAALYLRPEAEALYPAPQELADLNIEIRRGADYEHRAGLDLALCASGMACLENMLLGVPQIVFYAVSPSWILPLLKRFVNTPHMSLPNILASRELVPETAWGWPSGNKWAARRILDQSVQYLKDASKRERMRAEFASLSASLKTGQDASANAAAEIARFIPEPVRGKEAVG